jgi:hypothetical protein
MNSIRLNRVINVAIAIIVLLYCVQAFAENPEVIYSDPTEEGTVSCGVWTGSKVPVKVATVPVDGLRRCQFNYADWGPGSYKVRFTSIAADGFESPLSPDSVTVKRTNYVTFYRWQKTISWKCPPAKPCFKE